MKRYEPIINNQDAEAGPATEFVLCKNTHTLFIVNSEFVVPALSSDRHKELDH